MGIARRNKEMLAFIRKRKRYIKRDELLAFLAGRQLPPGSATSGSYHSTGRLNRLRSSGANGTSTGGAAGVGVGVGGNAYSDYHHHQYFKSSQFALTKLSLNDSPPRHSSPPMGNGNGDFVDGVGGADELQIFREALAQPSESTFCASLRRMD